MLVPDDVARRAVGARWVESLAMRHEVNDSDADAIRCYLPNSRFRLQADALRVSQLQIVPAGADLVTISTMVRNSDSTPPTWTGGRATEITGQGYIKTRWKTAGAATSTSFWTIFPRIYQLPTAPHTPCDVRYVIVLIRY